MKQSERQHEASATDHRILRQALAGMVCHRIEVYSWVGLIPLFATEIVDRRLLANAPRFADLLSAHKGGLFRGSTVCLCPDWENERGEHLLALVDHTMLPRILERLLDEEQFLSRFGIRSVSRIHATQTYLGRIPGTGEALMEYVPGESNSPLFGGPTGAARSGCPPTTRWCMRWRSTTASSDPAFRSRSPAKTAKGSTSPRSPP